MHIKTSDQEELKIGFGDFTINWGSHICGLYETEVERDEILFGFLKQGIIDKDVCVYVPSERTSEDFKEKFTHYCPECARESENKDLVSLFSEKEFYYPKGKFYPKDMENTHKSFYENSQKNGLKHVRATAEMDWVFNVMPDNKQLMAYESSLNNFIHGKPWISICLYNITKFSGSQIMSVLQTHPAAICKQSIIQNPYYVEPKKWLAENAPEYL